MDQSLTRDISKKKVPTWLTTCPKTRQVKAMHVGRDTMKQNTCIDLFFGLYFDHKVMRIKEVRQ